MVLDSEGRWIWERGAGTGLAPCARRGGGDEAGGTSPVAPLRRCRLGSAGAAPRRFHLSRSRSPAPVSSPPAPPPHPRHILPQLPKSDFFFFFLGGCWQTRGCLGGTSMGAEGAGAAWARPAQRGGRSRRKGEEKPGSLCSGRVAAAPRPPLCGPPQTAGIPASATLCQACSFATREVLAPLGWGAHRGLGDAHNPPAPAEDAGLAGSPVPWVTGSLGVQTLFFWPNRGSDGENRSPA